MKREIGYWREKCQLPALRAVCQDSGQLLQPRAGPGWPMYHNHLLTKSFGDKHIQEEAPWLSYCKGNGSEKKQNATETVKPY